MQQSEAIFTLSDGEDVKRQALRWASLFPKVMLLDGAQAPTKEKAFDWLIAVDVLFECDLTAARGFDSFHDFYNQHKGAWIMAALPYELQHAEMLDEVQPIDHPVGFCFVPRYVLYYTEGKLYINRPTLEAAGILDSIKQQSNEPPKPAHSIALAPTVKRETYLTNVQHIKNEIEEGRVYEVNYCIPFVGTMPNGLNLVEQYLAWSSKAKAPFSVFLKDNKRFALSFSPERFLSKRDNLLTSQPIKGTAKRGSHQAEDDALREQLANDPKERAENLMIADLVRNDLTRVAVPGSIEATELCGIYSFPTVHQMISTIQATLNHTATPIDALAACYPMGSMTGAPKRAAMQLIQDIENVPRGWYSGSFGYISPDLDMDWNVVIRTLIADEDSRALSMHSGGAITYDSIPENEYDEVLLKARFFRE